MPWIKQNNLNPVRIYEVPGAQPEPIEVYRNRYLAGYTNQPDLDRINKEVFDELEPESSVLLLGAGNSYWANNLRLHPNVSEIAALDFVKEAATNLHPSIEFFNLDILKDNLPIGFDYIFSSHTIEHFTRDEILNRILPGCLSGSRKGVIFIAPYATAWSDEPSHKCHFYENDELVSKATKYKLLKDNKEIVMWFNV